MKKIAFYEPCFFLLFGVFHLHRIWGLVDREAYAGFWLAVSENRDAFYYGLMLVLAAFCVLGIVSFFKNRRSNEWWRWIYLAGGGYLLFDLFALAAGLSFWRAFLLWMYDTASPYWNLIWGAFILLGGFSLCLGVHLLLRYRRNSKK